MKRYGLHGCLCLLSMIIAGVSLNAQQQIDIHTRDITLVLTIGKDNKLYQSYLGKRLMTSTGQQLLTAAGKVSSGDQPESYAPGGGSYLFEPAVRIVHGDGSASLDLRVADRQIIQMDPDNSVTIITLKDPVYPVTVDLYFSAFYKENVLKAHATIRQQEKKPVRVTNFASSMLHFNADQYYLTQFHGDWAEEMHAQESQLTSGIKIIDSKLGSRAHMFQTPAFLLSLNGPSSETEGEVLAGTLAWSGNFQFLFEQDEKNRLSLLAGMNPYASDYVLDPGRSFETPEFIFTYSSQGRGQASRNLHDWARNYGVLNGRGPRLTLLNNWEATQFDFNESKLEGLFDEAHLLGTDLFLLDDGWFGNKYPRNNDQAGLGDWKENQSKLPNGIAHLVKASKTKGVKFGIWIEPEMVNPKSELYEQHPDWILKLPNRTEDYYRNQLVLDLINPAVQQFVFQMVDNLLGKNPDIAYIKWDCNRMMTNTYSPFLKERQSNLYIDYVRSLYSILEKLRTKYPSIPMMLCSGGGGRTDYGALKYFTEFWPSDNTDPEERIFIQWGYSYFFPANTLSCHITSWGKQSLKFRTDVAMMGRLGYDIDVAKMSPKDLQFSQQAIQTYKRLSNVIWQGDQYRLISPFGQQRAALMYIDSSKQQAVVFAYTMHPRYGTDWTPVKLQGLDPLKFYLVREVDLYPGAVSELKENEEKLTGEYLMKVGLNISASGSLTSSVIELSEVKQN